jgi:uncharacterized membrane protein YgcG
VSRRLRIPATRVAVVSPAVLTVAVLLVISAFTGQAVALDGQVTVRAAGTTNASVTIKLSELGNNDINNRPYRLQSGTVQISGHSLLQVFNAADAESDEINLATIPAIEVDRPTFGTVRISGADLRNPAAFRDGPPVFYEDNGATVFVMPGSGTASGNRYRFVNAPVGISISSGASYEVSLSASRTRVKVGQKVNFTATVAGQDRGEQLSFSWRFGDGTTRTTNAGRISHTFAGDGDFAVILDVTGSSGTGQSGILIEVGEVARPKPKPKPNDKNGERNPEGTGGTGGSGGGGGGFGSGFGDGTGDFGSGSGGGPTGFAPGPSTPFPDPAPEPPARDPQQNFNPDDGLVPVQGELVDPQTGEVISTVPSDAQAVESADPATPGTEQGGFGIPGTAWTLAGVGLLLGLGAFAELRVFSRLY